MTKLWLTYAWKDNEDQDVDHVISELEQTGLTVNYDRAELLAGQRIWQQLDTAINDPSVDGWAMLVTENSLRSEPCQEEIAYALDRALRNGPAGFPLIGIFPSPIDRSIIPSAIATRLYVNLTAPDWKEQILSGVTKTKRQAGAPPPLPFGYTLHDFNGKPVVEVWPRSGRWYPFVAAVPLTEAERLSSVMYGPRGGITGTGMVASSGRQQNDQEAYEVISHSIDTNNSAHIFLNSLPTALKIGEPGKTLTVLSFNGA